ncbi:nitrate- and nitrite sensing domain-containing protein [Actinophytocola sp. S1-96]|uniref:histidine kinase n=1 Tax=Actinophytocola gossypii TaxID=2812003 RepID=A0ABT2JEF8_9PSEU|nr:nitrate- and nitrite sensing domain-containing protein [Actinophytocola gossypii]
MLAIALVPCIVFLLAGAGGTGYLIYDAASTRNYFSLASDAQRAALPLIVALQEERRLTLRRLASLGSFESDLLRQREQTDALVDDVTTKLGELADVAPASVQRDVGEFTTLMGELPSTRIRVDGAQVTVNDSFTFYNRIIDQFIEGTQGLAQFGPDAESVYALGVGVGPLLTAVDQMLRADALASANTAGGLDPADFRLYQGLVSAYHLQLEQSMRVAVPEVQQRYEALKDTTGWERLLSVEQALLDGGRNIPLSEDLWRGATQEVSIALVALLQTQARATIADAVDRIDTTLTQAIVAGVVVLLLAAAVFVFAIRLSRRLIERLTRLRAETLELAEQKLPALVESVRTGADVTVDDVRLAGHGTDEIGEVADAFNSAQRTAVAAAVQEAKTREGTKTVFLNIAHRSQVIVHRQLKVLDEAERKQEDPEQLEMLFQLDHLSTRARRNAENLIILGGGQPGRRWRNPVSLTELARGAAAETEDFARVKIAKLPAVAVNGPVVGDLVHLLAELIDNATSFSPPESRVEVRGNVVGRGVALEIEDQGLGIEADLVERLNGMLHRPPDFGIMALSTEPRLGLFVVARLAARHGISVTLRESAYGGTRAIVLLRAELLTEVPSAEDVTPTVKTPPVEQPTVLPLPASFLQPLPEFPVVAAKPGEDLFRPQLPVEETFEETFAETPAPERPTSPTGPERPAGRPPLPQRRRQQNLAPQLREDPSATAWPPADTEEVENSPDAARSRLSAFVQGTRRGREEPDMGNGNGENTVGSVRNGQHRAE